MRILRVGLALTSALVAAALLSCGKDEQEASKFERADNEAFVRDMSDMSSFTLANGVTVYLQEERTDNQVAVEVLYRAGFMDEPKGLVQISHLTEHLLVRCASGNFAPGESEKKLKAANGMISAEAVADFNHIDYVAPGDQLDMVLEIEAQRLRSIQCDDNILHEEVRKVVKEMDDTVADPKLALTRFAMMALNQTLYYGVRFVPIRSNPEHISLDAVHAFHTSQYRPDDLVLVIIGNVKKDEAEALVRKHFESIPKRASPPAPKPALKSNTRATWDVPVSSMYLVAPGPYADFHERIILTMFGSFLHQILNSSQDVYGTCRGVYASNQVYRVGDIPFFIFAQPAIGRSVADTRSLVLAHLDEAIAGLDDARVEQIKTSLIEFASSSMLKRDKPDFPLMHHQVIGQEALNVGMRHLLREGRTIEAFRTEVGGVSAEEMRAVVKKHLDRARLVEIVYEPARS